MRKYTFLCLLFALLTQCALGKDLRGRLEGQMQIQMQFQGKSFVLTLENNAAARDFYALLPLALSFSDYVGKEKIARLDKSLSTQESGEYDPQSGDFFYFAPWGNVGIFYAKLFVCGGNQFHCILVHPKAIWNIPVFFFA